jgi:hypothetical protein
LSIKVTIASFKKHNENFSHKPKIERLNPAISAGGENMAEKFLFLVQMCPGSTVVEFLVDNLKNKGSKPASSTRR